MAAVLISSTLYGQRPTAVDDSYTLIADSCSYVLPILANDSGVNGLVNGIQSIDTAGVPGTLSLGPGNNTLDYCPPAGFTGVFTFIYFICDTVQQMLVCDSAVVTVQVLFQGDSVWPGDANDDGIANNYDVLTLGLGFTALGPPRQTTSTAWQPHLSYQWNDTLPNGQNYQPHRLRW